MGIGIAIADTDLPKVEVLGKEYYYHEIKKGESIYGIAKQHDWDLNELIRLNPTAVSEMKKGTRLYYPTGRVTVVTDMPAEEPSEADSISVEPIMHHVKRGETVYSIARQYNIPVSQIYESCPNSKKGIKAGETLVIKQTPGSNAGSIIYYQIKPGDTLYSLARRYQTSVEEILKINPGISETNFRSGNTIKIAANSEGHKIRTELVDEERVASLESYKVGKNENWNDIARKTGVDVETLKDANEDVVKPKKNDVVNVPVVETVQVEKEYVEIDPREQTSEGIKELYDSIHGIDSQKAIENEVRVALVLDQPTAKKDIEFTRGFLTALDGMKREKFKIDFKVIDGRGASEKTTEILDAFKPNLIIATADKSFPVYLAEYGNANNVEVVNSFDLRNELCEENASMVQVLSPSSFFNQQMGEQLAEDYGNRQIVMVGSVDKSDGIADAFLNNVESAGVQKVDVDKLSNYNVTDDGRYLFYCYPTRKDEVADIMQGVANLKESTPFADIVVVGRPNWVTLVDNMGDKFGEAGVIVPSRVWFDTDSSEGKKFVKQFSELFGSGPLKSFPNFAASGYDIANYFIPVVAGNGGDFNRGLTYGEREMVQGDIRLHRINNWGGFTNRVNYFLKFRPGGYVDKIMIR